LLVTGSSPVEPTRMYADMVLTVSMGVFQTLGVGSNPTIRSRFYCYNFLRMFNVIDKSGFILNASPSLNDAMKFAKAYGRFVTIKSKDVEVCGIFGVDSVKDGVCPDGIAYDWNKASRIGRVRKR